MVLCFVSGGRWKGPSSLLLLPSERRIDAESLALNLPVTSFAFLCRLRSQSLYRLCLLCGRSLGLGAACFLLFLMAANRCAAFDLAAFGCSSSGTRTPTAANAEALARDNPKAIERRGSTDPNRTALIYVMGSVIRPGVVSVDPAHEPTLVEALAIAGGPTSSAALSKAILIRKQDGGRTVTKLNLERILHGEDPDVPIRDRDIIFIPWRRLKIISGTRRPDPACLLRQAPVSIEVLYSRRGFSCPSVELD